MPAPHSDDKAIILANEGTDILPHFILAISLFPLFTSIEREEYQITNMDTKSDPVTLAQKQLKENGFCVISDVLDQEETQTALKRLWLAVEESRSAGEETFKDFLDPNDSNIRVFYLMALDELFRNLIQHPTAISLVKGGM